MKYRKKPALLLKEMYKSGRGVQSGNRIFYPRKARTCKNCHFNDFDLHRVKTRGCLVFEAKDGKPEGICIPVRDDSGMSEIHANNVSVWIETLKEERCQNKI